MRRRLLLLLLCVPCLALAGAPASSPPPSPFAAIADAARPGIVTVAGYDKDDVLLRTRPGFFVGDTHVVTVRHPLIGAQRADVTLADGTVLTIAGVEADDPAIDLVLLRVTVPTDVVQLGTAGRTRRALHWATRAPAAGDLVIVVDDGRGDGRGVTAGTLKTYKTIPGAGAVLAIDAAVSPRREGSPVLTYDGEVVGAASVGYDQQTRKTVTFVSARVAALKAGPTETLPRWSSTAQAGMTRAAAELYSVARASVAAGNLEAALARLEQAVMKAPGHQDAWVTLGVVKARLERWDEAIECFERVVRLFRDHVEAQTNLCQALAHLERWRDAREHCDEAHRLADDDVRVLATQALITEHVGTTEAALRAYERVLEREPAHAEALYRKARLLLAGGRYPEAADVLQALCRVDAGYQDALRRLGDAWMGQERYHEAADAYAKALEVKGQDPAVHTRLGQAWLALNQPAKALQAFESAVRLQPSEARTYLALGQAFTHLKKIDQAIVMYRQAVRVDEAYATAWFELAELLRGASRLDEAREAYVRCVALDDRHVGALYGLGLTYATQQKRDEAWDQVRRLQPLDAAKARDLADRIIQPGS